MPAWLLNILIKLAVSVGLPYLIKLFPGLPSEIWGIIEEILKHIQTADNQKQAVQDVKAKVRECTGVACSANLKGE